MAGMGKQIADKAKNAAKDKIKETIKKAGRKITTALLTNPIFWLITGIMFIILIIIGAFMSVDPESGGYIGDNAEFTENGDFYGSTPTDWWWPIGSKETTTENGKLFASGDPVPCVITSGVGPRWGTSHNGIDIAPIAAWSIPGPYIISAAEGKVIEAIDGFDDNGSLDNWDGNGFGNHIVVDYGDGITITYGHLSKNTVRVKVRRNSNIWTSHCKNGT